MTLSRCSHSKGSQHNSPCLGESGKLRVTEEEPEVSPWETFLGQWRIRSDKGSKQKKGAGGAPAFHAFPRSHNIPPSEPRADRTALGRKQGVEPVLLPDLVNHLVLMTFPSLYQCLSAILCEKPVQKHKTPSVQRVIPDDAYMALNSPTWTGPRGSNWSVGMRLIFIYLSLKATLNCFGIWNNALKELLQHLKLLPDLCVSNFVYFSWMLWFVSIVFFLIEHLTFSVSPWLSVNVWSSSLGGTAWGS